MEMFTSLNQLFSDLRGSQTPLSSLLFANLVIWRHWRPPDRQIGDLLAQNRQKKYVSKCLKLPNSSRNAIKIFCPYVTRARKNAQKYCAQCLFLPFFANFEFFLGFPFKIQFLPFTEVSRNGKFLFLSLLLFL